MKLRLLLTAIVLVGCVLGAATLSYIQLQMWSRRPISIPEPVVIELQRGTTLAQFSDQLHVVEVIKYPQIFQLWVKLFSDYSKFQAGSYRLSGRVSPEDIAATIRGGATYAAVLFELVIPEGHTAANIGTKLETAGIGTAAQFVELTRSKKLIAELGISAESLEGYLFPATYRFSEIPTQKEVITEVINTFWQRLPSDYPVRAAQRGLTLDQAITFASLIEMETPFDDERTMVAEVIWRRLADKAPLAIDATIIYGIKDYQGDITREHLRDATNPYNTRIHGGLPPTAIGSPTIKSLEAVLQPTNKGYYFYVVDVDKNGRHHFSKTIAEHNLYVEKLRRKKN